MAKKKETVSRTVVVALALCIVCSVIVSTAAVVLKPAQITNRNLDMKTNILAAAGMLQPGASADEIEEQFQRFDVRLVNLESGEYVDPQSIGLNDAMAYDQYRASADPEMSEDIPSSEDKAGIKRQADIAKVFVLQTNGELERIVLPIHGYGLWSTLYGFVSLEGDANTIEGLGFYAHAETPGLGGEVDNPKWKAQWVGKKVYGENLEEPEIQLVKGGVDPNAPDAEHKVDALSGATLTSRGVQQLVNFWMSERGFAPYLNKLREGEV
ncbi:Na(+)-translocating NADH-quinone reductase subunit C [Marinobacter nanhaiticus D15-8W]|uniref:Na(+)-translocating NADH-quinone reductase subunit C n=1 Tax=Marinobacter nanhaiticus D15-8W TaxID=626887 RepID=N6WR86_9GAMM|nr:Na(+)-translocating NADH-quinone reductase subunit C [Marinobacter nanhaiticus]ENO13572.1 Na(+)-translocating NADH-quinone reductase subunit C [Marinobacter nanhaiticus D15-8W]BES70943.1 Na(+)-translocating NADH-quinone reductase subunit C [Marinobacter nanhaiticus D15-8W]